MSARTTAFTALSFRTTLSESATTLALDMMGGGVGGAEAHFLSRNTTSAASTANMVDGELSVMSVIGLQATLAFRSGNTIHTWASTGTIV